MLTSRYTINKPQGSHFRLLKKATISLVSFRMYRLDYGMLWRVLAISLFFQFKVVVINEIYTLPVFIDVPFGDLLVVIPLVFWTEVLPISINGIGVKDSALVFLSWP